MVGSKRGGGAPPPLAGPGFYILYSYDIKKCCEMHTHFFNLGGFGSLKKNGENWESNSNPPLANLGILNCYFFIGYLALIDQEMDFEMNLFFPLTKVV